jgi:hypothetical protein
MLAARAPNARRGSSGLLSSVRMLTERFTPRTALTAATVDPGACPAQRAPAGGEKCQGSVNITPLSVAFSVHPAEESSGATNRHCSPISFSAPIGLGLPPLTPLNTIDVWPSMNCDCGMTAEGATQELAAAVHAPRQGSAVALSSWGVMTRTSRVHPPKPPVSENCTPPSCAVSTHPWEMESPIAAQPSPVDEC